MSDKMDYRPYHKTAYWNKRYAEDTDPFEWYFDMDTLSSLLDGWLDRPNCRVLDVGCGTSEIGPHMLDANDTIQYTGMDICKSVIKHMSSTYCKKYSDKPGSLKYRVGDARRLQRVYGPSAFHVVVDKGTIDALLSSGKPDIAAAVCEKELSVLKGGGVLVVCSQASPDSEAGAFIMQHIFSAALERYPAHNRFHWFIHCHVLVPPEDEKNDAADGSHSPESFPSVYLICKQPRRLLRRASRRPSVVVVKQHIHLM